MAEVEHDLGGRDQLSAMQRQIVQHASVLGAVLSDVEARFVIGEPVDLMQLCMLANCQRRLLETLGVERKPKDVTPSLEQYTQQRHLESAG